MATTNSDLDFDVLEFCRKLRTSKQPPYTCPIVECGKTYKSMCGLQYHLVIFDHNSVKKGEGINTPATPAAPVIPGPMSSRKSKKKKKFGKGKQQTPKPAQVSPLTPKERRPCAENQDVIEFEIDNEIIRLSIDDKIPLVSKHNWEMKHGPLTNWTNMELPKSKDLLKLPEPKFSLIDDYHLPTMAEKPTGYIRFIEKSAEDLDGEVEYDMDEEDSAWLDIINNIRSEQNLSPVTVDVFELLMDRLEKESYFQMKTNSQAEGPAMIDDDAICCICMDGECQNSNVILFCDMCNLAVHQDCYGVPYIPEGQWLCRRCLQSPSRAVDCVLCPNNGGAFKQTDRGHWAHVVCALWIPEVRFANTVFLEPIDSIETIPPARWKLTCYLCKQRGVGACIQCHKTNCYSAFHVTCAQAAGLYMNIDAVKDTSPENKGKDLVEKIAYCETHAPPNAEQRPKLNVNDNALKQQKSSTAPVISIPTIPPEKIQEIGSLVSIAKKSQFVQRLIAYWTLKRQLRNGVPLLRRLQTTHMNKKESQSTASRNDDLAELGKQLKYWQHLRQDLERARLLCELVRKREKLKRELTKVKAASLEMELVPFKCYLTRLLDLIRAKDTGEIFIEPVDQTEVPDYNEIVKNPMDLSTMRAKIEAFEYDSLADFKADFVLMINNCLAYNSKETAFYRAAVKMRDQCANLFKQAEKDLDNQGLQEGSPRSGEPNQESTEGFDKPDLDISDFDVQLVNLTNNDQNMDDDETMEKLNRLMEMTKGIRHGQARTKRVKLIKTLIAKIKRSRTKSRGKPSGVASVSEEPGSESDEEKPGRRVRKSVKGEAPPETRKGSPGKTTSRRRGRTAKNEDLEAISKKSDSFRQYRSTEVSLKSDEEDGTDDGSSCSECSSGSGSGSCSGSGTAEWTDSDGATSGNDQPKEKLEQLQLVWAKCRGYPWYPALIINPKMPRGYVHNGVPIPSPPADVIALANNYTEPVYLVLFFDTKRTWQWLPRNKLEPLGVNEELDEMKLVLSRKPADRKAVRKAYQEAMQHRTQIDKPSPTSQKS